MSSVPSNNVLEQTRGQPLRCGGTICVRGFDHRHHCHASLKADVSRIARFPRSTTALSNTPEDAR